jgi:CHAT domain-containing protein
MTNIVQKFVQKAVNPVNIAKSIYYVNISGFYSILGQSEKVLKLNEVARNTFIKENGWKITSARCDKNMAKEYYNLGYFKKATVLFKSAREKFKEVNKQIYVGLCELNMAHAYYQQGHYDKALEPYISARKIFENKGQKKYVANIDRKIASVYSHLGQIDKAIRINRSARQLIDRKILWKAETARCDIDLAAIYSNIGQDEKAIELFMSAREIFENWGSQIDVAKCDISMATNLMLLGQNEMAIEALKSARKIFMKKGIHNHVANCDLETAKIYSRLGQFEKAIELSLSARTFFKIFEEKNIKKDMTYSGVASCDFSIANNFYLLGQYEKALEQYKSIRKDLFEKGLKDEVTNCDFNIACVYLLLKKYKKAIKLFQSTRKAYEEKGLKRDIAFCNLNMAAVYMRFGRLNNAFTLLKKVKKIDDLNLKAKSLFGIGCLYWRQGNTKLAKSYCKAAIKAVENIRDSLSQDDLGTSFLGTVFDYYYIMVEICLESNDFKNALKYVERLKSRSLVEMLANRDLLPKNATKDEIQNYRQLRSKIRACYNQLHEVKNPAQTDSFPIAIKKLEKEYEQVVTRFRKKDPSFDPDQKIAVSYSDISNLVPDNESAIVEFFPMTDKTVVFIIKNDQTIEESSVIIRDYNGAKLTSHINELLERYLKYREGSNSSQSKAKQLWEGYLEEILEELYNKLFLRIIPHLNNIKKIVMVPYSSLHLLPLHAMSTKVNGRRRYIIDDYLVTYAPSLKVLKHCMERRRKKQGKTIIAHANTQINNNYLKFSQNEISAINEMFENSEVLNKATKADIINSGKEAHILHYTGHAHFTALILHKEKDLELEEEYGVEDIFESLYLPEADLVTLSACETGMMLPKGVDEAIGITSGLIHAGATTVISSLWSVSDVSTSLLMRKMYELINKGRGKAEALREAQLWLKNPDNRQEHFEMFKNNGNKEKLYDQNRGFTVQSVDWEELLPDDFHRPYHWSGFICSGVA